MSKICKGCGAVLQSNHEDEIGYIAKDKLAVASYCQRCFKIIHYNEKKVTILPEINKYILEEINKNSKFVYFMIDILNINNETIGMYKKIKGDKSLIISKLDVIPKGIKKEKIKEWLNTVYGVKEEIFFQSSKKNLCTRSIINYLNEKNIKSCYIVGYTNSGKSSLINKICELSDVKGQELTTCLIPNTTIDFVQIKINDKLTIIDSPGFTLENPIYKEDDFDLIEEINPRCELKPITYQVKENTYINIRDLMAINAGNKNSLTLYISNALKVDRVFKIKENMSSKDFIKIKVPDNSDLVIKSVGYINIKKKCELTIYSDNKEIFEVRKSMFGGSDEERI